MMVAARQHFNDHSVQNKTSTLQYLPYKYVHACVIVYTISKQVDWDLINSCTVVKI